MTAKLLSLLLVAVLLAGCGGGVVTVCGESNWPDYCKQQTSAARAVAVLNDCPGPLQVEMGGGLTGKIVSGVVRPGERATFRVPIVAEESLTWSGRVYAREDPAAYAELALLSDNADQYIVRNSRSLRLAMKPDTSPRRTGMYAQVPAEYWCRSAQGESTLSVCRADHAAANDLDYTITFCAP